MQFDGGIQRRHPRRVCDVWIRTAFQQQSSNVVVTVDDGHCHRGCAVGILHVQIGVSIGEGACRVHGALPGGEHQRSESTLWRRKRRMCSEVVTDIRERQRP